MYKISLCVSCKIVVLFAKYNELYTAGLLNTGWLWVCQTHWLWTQDVDFLWNTRVCCPGGIAQQRSRLFHWPLVSWNLHIWTTDRKV